MADLLIPNTGQGAPALVAEANGRLVTTTVAIAEGTQVQHKNVLELVRTYLADLEEFGGVAFQTRPFETPGGTQQREVAELNEEQATLLLTYMRNSEVVRQFKKRLVKAFWEMKRNQQPGPDPMQVLNDPAALRSLLLGYNEKVLELQPKADALDRLSKTAGSVTLREAAGMEQVQERWFLNWLHGKGWIYKAGRDWLPYADARKDGYLEMPARKFRDPNTGEERLGYRVRVTPRGLARIAEMLAKESFVPRTQPELV